MSREKAKKLSKKIIFLIVSAVIISCILIAALGLQIAFLISDKIECWSPAYEKEDISEILDKTQLTDEDYDVLYKQTGLTRLGIDRAMQYGNAGRQRIKSIQDAYFKQYEVENDLFAPYVCTDRLAGNTCMLGCYLETGDIIVTASTHISSVRIGHSGIVLSDGTSPGVLQAMAYGTPTFTGRVSDFTSRVNFMVFQVKTDKETRKKAAAYALETFNGSSYEGLIGVFSDKDRIDKTQCSHLIWKTYKEFGIDLDYNGGALVTPKDIANSPEVELVQVFGFDPVTLWK